MDRAMEPASDLLRVLRNRAAQPGKGPTVLRHDLKCSQVVLRLRMIRRGLAFLRTNAKVGAVLQQQPDNLCVPILAGIVQRRFTKPTCRSYVHVGAVGCEDLNDVDVAFLRGDVQRREAEVVLHVGVLPERHEAPHRVDGPPLSD
eukprot:CAMPEP_0198558904 /NCGR_PEP_ID=MMETSP1462-20131121/91342_1 /TAXON_ID=1333877 /ORGANISM="Brandtodinium nutriculum, Strain RCC3387" /LENGTH=144 /DNA_ID=CAMNT_0044289741 /DNA_START=221 /DNA_END=652 /DNA_ORIENTATION=+